MGPARKRGSARLAAGIAAVGLVAACGGGGSPTSAAAQPFRLSPATTGACPRTVVAAGDMNGLTETRQTGALAVRLHPGVVAALGDLQYPDGSLADFRSKYDRTGWGQLKSRTRPVPGNHEYHTGGAAGYFAYFGHPPKYYAYDLGCGWRGYALNSEVDLGPEVSWLRRDLAAHRGAAVLAYWHRPRFSSGTEHGSDKAMAPLWTALAGRRAVVLNGHEHNYERFAMLGTVREFVVGTGGSSTYPFAAHPVAGSVKRIAHTPGVLVLRLGARGAYAWAFRNRAGAVLDAG